MARELCKFAVQNGCRRGSDCHYWHPDRTAMGELRQISDDSGGEKYTKCCFA